MKMMKRIQCLLLLMWVKMKMKKKIQFLLLLM